MDARRALLESLVVVAIAGLGVLAASMLPLEAPPGRVGFGRSAEAVQVEGALEPALVGMNTLTLTVRDPAGQPLEGAEIEVTWFPLDTGLTVTRRLGEDGAGRYSVRNLALVKGGRWQLLLVVRVAGQSQLWTVDWLTGSGSDLRLAEDPAPRVAWIEWVNVIGLPAIVVMFTLAVLVWTTRVVRWKRAPDRALNS